MNSAETIGCRKWSVLRKTFVCSHLWLNVSSPCGSIVGVMVLIQFGNNLTDISNYSTNFEVQRSDQEGHNGSWRNDSDDSFDPKSFVISYLGEQRGDIGRVVVLTVVYMIVYMSGVLGNSLTFLVIYKNPYMRTVTNCYLMSLALSDLLTISVGKYVFKLSQRE